MKEDQTYTVRDLWRGVFLRSGNDAVHVLAAMNGGKDKTVREMNEQAKKLQAERHARRQPRRLRREGPGLLRLRPDAVRPLRDAQGRLPRVRGHRPRASSPARQKKGKKERETYEIQNTNRLLTGDVGLEPYPGIAGVKNGSTTNAGATFTGVAQRGDRVLLVT